MKCLTLFALLSCLVTLALYLVSWVTPFWIMHHDHFELGDVTIDGTYGFGVLPFIGVAFKMKGNESWTQEGVYDYQSKRVLQNHCDGSGCKNAPSVEELISNIPLLAFSGGEADVEKICDLSVDGSFAQGLKNAICKVRKGTLGLGLLATLFEFLCLIFLILNLCNCSKTSVPVVVLTILSELACIAALFVWGIGVAKKTADPPTGIPDLKIGYSYWLLLGAMFGAVFTAVLTVIANRHSRRHEHELTQPLVYQYPTPRV